jgi:hypothetical protein
MMLTLQSRSVYCVEAIDKFLHGAAKGIIQAILGDLKYQNLL